MRDDAREPPSCYLSAMIASKIIRRHIIDSHRGRLVVVTSAKLSFEKMRSHSLAAILSAFSLVIDSKLTGSNVKRSFCRSVRHPFVQSSTNLLPERTLGVLRV